MLSNKSALYGRMAASQGFTHLPLGTDPNLPPFLSLSLFTIKFIPPSLLNSFAFSSHPIPLFSSSFLPPFPFPSLTPSHPYRVAPGTKPTASVETLHTGKSLASTPHSLTE